MKQKFLVLIKIFILIISADSFGQTSYSKENQIKIDSGNILITNSCSNIIQNKTISKNKIHLDKQRILFLNDFYNNDLPKEVIKVKLKKFFKNIWNFDSLNLGGIIKYETIIPSEGNLEVFISFSTCKENVMFKRIYFRTKTKIECSFPYQNTIASQDIYYLQKNIIPILNLPINYEYNVTFITCDTLLIYKFKQYKDPNSYVVTSSLRTQNDLNNMIWFRNDKYQIDYVVRDIADIVKIKDTSLLINLLYSPNYILSLYAMESLIFFSETNQIVISHKDLLKMDSIKNADIKIVCQYSDVILRGTRYIDLKIEKSKIMSKYLKL